MFETNRKRTRLQVAWAMTELTYHSMVRAIRGGSNNAVVGLLMNMLTAVMLVIIFYVMNSLLGLRDGMIRGNYIVFLFTGIFLFLTHVGAVGAVMGAPSSVSAMMLHAPMNTTVAIISSALASLFKQLFSAIVVLFVYHVAFEPIEIFKPLPTLGAFILGWFTGCCVGMFFLALKPWIPKLIGVISQVYTRANMIASGKMFLANMLPGYMLRMFDWNPLFHCIDQTRGFAFLNYNPRYSNLEYPITIGLILLVIGLLGEFYARKKQSISWSARS